MKSTIRILTFINLALIIGSCSDKFIDDNTISSEFIVGKWNSYESGTEQNGFNPGIASGLTIAYESGLTFSDDGTFRVRRFNNGVWKESETVGIFQMSEKIVSLIYFPHTKDEFKFDLTIIKLDENHFWIRHHYFGDEIEHHLERTNQ